MYLRAKRCTSCCSLSRLVCAGGEREAYHKAYLLPRGRPHWEGGGHACALLPGFWRLVFFFVFVFFGAASFFSFNFLLLALSPSAFFVA